MFMVFMWMMTSLAGSVVMGDVAFVQTSTTVALTETSDTVHVSDTTGFPNSGMLAIRGEYVAYSRKTDTTFSGTSARPIVRGSGDTDAQAHPIGTPVTTVGGGMLNSAASYNIAVMSDPSGVLAFLTLPIAFFLLIGNFLFLPLEFLGTNLQFLFYLWLVIVIGMVAAISLALMGGRRV